MIRRLGLAVLLAGMVAAGLSTATAVAAPDCADYHWIGAAGSGQRDGAAASANGGMGDVVYRSYQQIRSDLAASGKTITAEAVQYPAAPVPEDGGIGGWLTFLGSVNDGTDATAEQLEAFTEKCPATKVVLAGYSQGAMVIHRNLHDLADNPNIAAALLVADGDRLAVDTTINMGSTALARGTGKGVAQEHSFLSSANTAMLPPTIGARTISVCDFGDPVCDYRPESTEISTTAVAVHTAYTPALTGPHAWGPVLAQLITRDSGERSATSSPVQLAAGNAVS